MFSIKTITIPHTFHFDVDEVFRDRLERELEAAHDVVGKLADDLENVLRQNLLQNFVLKKLTSCQGFKLHSLESGWCTK